MLRLPSFLSAADCATLRSAVDRGAATDADSVDGLADHQLDMLVEGRTADGEVSAPSPLAPKPSP